MDNCWTKDTKMTFIRYMKVIFYWKFRRISSFLLGGVIITMSTLPENIRIMGGKMTGAVARVESVDSGVRVLMHVKMDDCEKDIFFTEESYHTSPGDGLSKFIDYVSELPSVDRITDFIKRGGTNVLYVLGNCANGLNMRLKDYYPEADYWSEKERTAMIVSDKFSVQFSLEHKKIKVYYNHIYGDNAFENDYASAEKKRLLYIVEKKAQHYYSDCYTYDRILGVDEGEAIAKRNVAMSKVATLIGNPQIVAKSEFVELDINGNIKKGIAMDRAKGSDLAHFRAVNISRRQEVPADADPIQLLSEEVMNKSGQLKRDIADMQVLDYLCGNFDRHERHIIYNVVWKNREKGEVEIKGIQGIDNDGCMGTVDDEVLARKSMTTPTDMLVMRRATADVIMNKLTAEVLRDNLADLCFTEEELRAMENRLLNLKAQLHADEDYFSYRNPVTDITLESGHIRVLEDSAFENEKLSIKDIAEKVSHKSLFKTVSIVPGLISKTTAKQLYFDKT